VEELVTGLNRPSGIVLDSAGVYWTDSQDNSVYSVDKAGGAKVTLAVGGATGPITLVGSTLYWATGAAIARIQTNGTNQQAVVGGESLVADLTSDGTNLYWLRTGTWSGSTYNNDGSVARVALSGGTPVSLTTNSQKRPTALAVDATHVYWVNEGSYTGLSYNNDGSVLRVGKTGGAAMTIATSQNKPCGIAVNDSTVYWANCGNGVVMMADKGSPPKELLSGLSISEGLRLDGKELFWPYLGPNPNVATGEVRKASVSSLTVLVLATQQHQPFRVAVDSTHVFWLNHGGAGDPPPGNGSLMRVAR
jgi:sugar lactone lactonase YvrE